MYAVESSFEGVNVLNTPLRPVKKKRLSLNEKLRNLRTISADNPDSIKFFNSELKIEQEKQRHLENYPYTIHPLSKFNQYYEVYCFFFYTTQIVMNAFIFAFVRVSIHGPFVDYSSFHYFDIFLDVTSILNMIMLFFVGFTHKTHIELSISKIIFRSIVSGHFFCDLFSSISMPLLWNSENAGFLLVHTLSLMKIRRISTVIYLIRPVTRFFKITSPVQIFTLAFFFLGAMISHFLSCFHMGLTRYRSSITGQVKPVSVASANLLNLTINQQYMTVMLRNSQYVLQISVEDVFHRLEFIEEQIFGFIKYVIGKSLIVSSWIVILTVIMSKMKLNTTFEEVITELNDYMIAKQLPEDLKLKMIGYYKFKYHKSFINERYMRSIFSTNLKREMDVFLYKTLINQVSIFSHVPQRSMQVILTNLIPEIYLPTDLIIQSGTYGDCMYFIESGTVAVFTPAGKEVCHLYDGDYFGEVSLLTNNKKRMASIIAIEATRMYKLKKKVFYECFKKNEHVYEIIREQAKKRVALTDKMEKYYKQVLLGKQVLQRVKV